MADDFAILAALAEDRPRLTGAITMAVRGERNPTETAIMSRRLRGLETAGLVRRLDREKPVVWARTRAGTEKLAGR